MIAKLLVFGAACQWSAATSDGSLELTFSPDTGPAFPAGRRFSPARFWAASPLRQLYDASRDQRPALDFVASGEAGMLAWSPPAGAGLAVPLRDSPSLVRLLSAGHSAEGTPGKAHSDGDVVLRDTNGGLVTQWELLWSRLDVFVNNSVPEPILVLDNVPFAFCPPGKCDSISEEGYGMVYGPEDVNEYAAWIETLLHAMVSRYGKQRASSLWFRVGTEPNTQPNHWNDTNQKYVDMYVAVSETIGHVLPDARVGMANWGLDGNAEGFDTHVMPMAAGIADSGARVDFLGMSCYGREKQNRFAVTTAALCDTRLQKLRALSPSWATIPAQIQEYGIDFKQEGGGEYGVFGAAFMLATSVAHAAGAAVERGFTQDPLYANFAHDDAECAPSVSPTPCALYDGRAWVQAQAGHLFGEDDAVVLQAGVPGSNASATEATGADGLGGWSPGGQQLRFLLTAYSPERSDNGVVRTRVSFKASSKWSSSGLAAPGFQMRSAILDDTTAMYDVIYREAKANGWLAYPDDPNMYRLSGMLTKDGLAALQEQRGAAYLALQRQSFSSSSWADTGRVHCDESGECYFAIEMTPPSVLAVWLRQAPSSEFV